MESSPALRGEKREGGAGTRCDAERERVKTARSLPLPLSRPSAPNVNVPERIVLCVDACCDERTGLFKLGDGSAFTQLDMFKRVLDFFLQSKQAINRRTEFALVLLGDREARWAHGFTSDVRELLGRLEGVRAEESIAEEFDLGRLLDCVAARVRVPGACGPGAAPPYAVRLLVLYGRSRCVPRVPADCAFVRLLRGSPHAVVDLVLSHEEACARHRCEEVYDALQDLDTGYSYVFEVSRKATKLHDCIAKLLAHPLQRPLQKDTDYTFRTQHA